MNYVMIVGAKSDIAVAVAREYAKNGYDLILAARNTDDLDSIANDIQIRYQKSVETLALDILDTQSHQSIFDSVKDKLAGVVCAVGYMGEQSETEQSPELIQKVVDSNFTGVAHLLSLIANDFEQKQSGFIVAISSVAGERGRKANYVYGSAKAGLTAFLSGLRNRLFESKVQVLTVKPGFVATKMTEGMDLPEKLTAQPEEVATAIFNAQQKGRNVLHVKSVWFLIMLIIKNIPEFIFKRLSI